MSIFNELELNTMWDSLVIFSSMLPLHYWVLWERCRVGKYDFRETLSSYKWIWTRKLIELRIIVQLQLRILFSQECGCRFDAVKIEIQYNISIYALKLCKLIK